MSEDPTKIRVPELRIPEGRSPANNGFGAQDPVEELAEIQSLQNLPESLSRGMDHVVKTFRIVEDEE